MISGVCIQDNHQGRCIIFDHDVTKQVFINFLNCMLQQGLAFSLYDPLYPSPSDPGAYLSYIAQEGIWLMTIGNHGWSGGVYHIHSYTIAQQLFNLFKTGQLLPLNLDHINFFEHYPVESEENNARMNDNILKIHS